MSGVPVHPVQSLIMNTTAATATAAPERTYVVGTAGHVDHGKSTLVRALTGIDPDRLAEEKAREMTIDLGFAWLTLPSGQTVSIVDVPGHERFIKNMLAGVGGIDAALLVVAADEGPMPQTVEHLAILDLLGVDRGVIVLTKADAVEADWLDLVREEVRELVSTTSLTDAPIVTVSALTGEGLPTLLETLEAVLASSPGTASGGPPRLPVDRVFSVSGFGTVVTGTLSGGEINTGDELRLYPGVRRARVRGLQSHQEKVSRALPGRRTAVNLSGITTEEVRRGDVLAPPGIMSPSQRLDARLRLLPDAPVALKQNDEVDFFTGAAELPARITLLDRERLDPGESAWAQLRFRAPIAVLRNDRFVVRRPSPSETLGGGEIVDPSPPRHRRFRPETIAALETLAAGAPDEILLQALERGPIEIKELAAGAAGLSSRQIDEALAQLIAEGDVVVLGGSGRVPGATDFVVASSLLESLTRQASDMLRSYHASQPLRPGLAREEARRRLGIAQARLFDDLIATMAGAGELIDDGATLRLQTFHMTLEPGRRAAADQYLTAIRTQPYTPPGPHEHGLDPETLAALEYLGEVIKIADGVYFAPETWDSLVQGTLAFVDSNGSMTLSQFRDHFSTSRKYAQAALEYLDQLKYTRRVGDDRVRGPRRPPTA